MPTLGTDRPVGVHRQDTDLRQRVTCGRSCRPMPAITTVTARISPGSNGHPIKTGRSWCRRTAGATPEGARRRDQRVPPGGMNYSHFPVPPGKVIFGPGGGRFPAAPRFLRPAARQAIPVGRRAGFSVHKPVDDLCKCAAQLCARGAMLGIPGTARHMAGPLPGRILSTSCA